MTQTHEPRVRAMQNLVKLHASLLKREVRQKDFEKECCKRPTPAHTMSIWSSTMLSADVECMQSTPGRKSTWGYHTERLMNQRTHKRQIELHTKRGRFTVTMAFRRTHPTTCSHKQAHFLRTYRPCAFQNLPLSYLHVLRIPARISPPTQSFNGVLPRTALP